MRRNSGGKKQKDKPRDFWQSYSDMMAALLLVFVLALAGSILSARLNMEEREKRLRERETELIELLTEKNSLIEENSEKDEQLSEYEKLKRDYATLEGNYISEKNKSKNLSKKVSELETEKASLNSELAQKSSELDENKSQLAAKTEEAKKQKEELEKIVGVRQSLIDRLSQEFSDTNLKVDKQTGAITFTTTMLFDKNKDDLKGPGREFLENFFPRYVSVLLSDEFIDSVAEIIIEGHTDTDGSYMYNLKLSQNRALAVASYFLGEDGKGSDMFSPKVREQLRKIVTANGRSFSTPIFKEDGSIDMEASRRVEIQFRLKDEEMIRDMMETLE